MKPHEILKTKKKEPSPEKGRVPRLAVRLYCQSLTEWKGKPANLSIHYDADVGWDVLDTAVNKIGSFELKTKINNDNEITH